MLALQAFPDKSPQEISELEALKANLQGINDFESFTTVQPRSVTQTPLADLFKSIRPGSIVIDADLTTYGFCLFGVTCQGLEFARQKPTNYYKLRIPTMYVMKHVQDCFSEDSAEKTPGRDGDAAFVDALQIIAEEILVPLTALLDSSTHIIFAISNIWATFPLCCFTVQRETLSFAESHLVRTEFGDLFPSLSETLIRSTLRCHYC